MHKCCENCRYFYGCLEDPDSYFHIHEYCSIWQTTLSGPMHSLINNFLDSGCYDVSEEELPEGLDLSMYDDHETGESYCYRFEALPEGTRENRLSVEHLEARLKDAFDHNKRLALAILDIMLKKNKVWFCDKADDMDEEDRQYYTELRAKIEAQEWENR